MISAEDLQPSPNLPLRERKQGNLGHYSEVVEATLSSKGYTVPIKASTDSAYLEPEEEVRVNRFGRRSNRSIRENNLERSHSIDSQPAVR